VNAEKPEDSSPEFAKRAMRGPRPDAETADRSEPMPSPADRLTAVEQTAGALTGTYGPSYFASLREDWPA
jgi:hypothetical protein